MRNNETGEFELVVGNRQILSGFFIVVLLFAVGVAMGYFLGQNTPRSAKLPAETSAAAVPPGDARPQPASPAPQPQSAVDAAQPAGDAGPQPSTQPARDSGQAAAEPAAAPPPAVTTPSANIPEAPAGTYWQVMAVGKSDADVVVRALKDKGFAATSSPGTKGLTRVLVGPYPDRTAMGRAKGELEAAGFNTLYRVEIGADQGRR